MSWTRVAFLEVIDENKAKTHKLIRLFDKSCIWFKNDNIGFIEGHIIQISGEDQKKVKKVNGDG